MTDLDQARRGDERAFRAVVAPYERELRAFCYRMSGSLADTDDLMQDVWLRAWRGLPTFESRASLRTWLYRVASSACIDRLKGRAARKRAEDVGPAAHSRDPMPDAGDDWIGPCPPSVYADDAPSPEARYRAKESVTFAFLAALQMLPPKQRATLVGCDVLGFSAEECADMLETTSTSVHSALARARETVAARRPQWTPTASPAEVRELVDRYVDAWNRGDGKALVALLHDDATMSMPPIPVWLSGARSIVDALETMVFASCAPDSFRALHTEANGLPALALFRQAADGTFAPYALHVLAFDDGKLRSLTAFLDTRVFAPFDLDPVT